jgi:two-component system response regulator ResD
VAAETDQPLILVVDDEAIVTEVVERYLEREGYGVRVARDGEAALTAFEESRPALVVLDLMLPKVDGLDVCRRLRSIDEHTPIIMLTAKGEEIDRILGLEFGADDYMTKPFSPRELVARVKAVLRRARPDPTRALDSATLHFGRLTLNPRSRVVEIARRPVELTAKEFDLLAFLARHAGQVFTREQLLDQVWDYQYYGDASTVTVHIRRLREKIEDDPARPRYVKTVWGVGYKFDEASA